MSEHIRDFLKGNPDSCIRCDEPWPCIGKLHEVEADLAAAQARADEAEAQCERLERTNREFVQWRNEMLAIGNRDLMRAEAAEQQVAVLRAALEKVVLIADRCDDAGSEYWQAGLIAKNALAAVTSPPAAEPRSPDPDIREPYDGTYTRPMRAEPRSPANDC